MLEGAKSSYLGVPIVTRVWSSVIVVLALLSQIGVPPELLQLDGALIVKKLQLWRLITSASFFGGIGAQLRKLCGLGRAASGVPQLVLLDLGVGGYVKLESKDVTKDAIATLLADYRAGKLELQSPNAAR